MTNLIETIESQGPWPNYVFDDYLCALHTLQSNGYIGGHDVLTVHGATLHRLLNEKTKDDKFYYNVLAVDLGIKVVTADISKNTAFLHTYNITQMIPTPIINEGTVKIINIQSLQGSANDE